MAKGANVTPAQARNFVKHEPVCKRCGADVFAPACIPKQQNMHEVGPLEDSWYCAYCKCNHANKLKRHMRNGAQICDTGAYRLDTAKHGTVAVRGGVK